MNQKQTFRQEIDGGYLWSPKRKSDGSHNPYYEFMREVAPGDVIFSFANAQIRAIGIARGFCRESPKPTEFGTAGTNWSQIGWKVDVQWRLLAAPVRPKDQIGRLADLLPRKYAPLTREGNGLQNIYLTEVPAPLASALFGILGKEASDVRDVASQLQGLDPFAEDPDTEEWERRIESKISHDPHVGETEKRALILARRGQGKFRQNVRQVEKACRITKVSRAEHLIASHVKPWRDCEKNEERLDGENGLLLTPTIDHLFDKGFISFEDNGRLIISSVADLDSLSKMGIEHRTSINVGAFSEGQRRYLEYHRENVLRVAGVKR